MIPNERVITLLSHHDDEGYWTIQHHPAAQYYNMEGQDALTDYMLAHDVIEHVNGWQNICTVEDELEALGAVILSRVEPGEILIDAIKQDVINTWSYMNREIMEAPVRKLDPLIEEYAEELRFTLSDLEDSVGDLRPGTTLPMDEILLWLSSGYEKATKIYNLHHFHMHNMYHNVKYAVKDVIPQPGVVYHLTINNKQEKVTLDEHWEFDD